MTHVEEHAKVRLRPLSKHVTADELEGLSLKCGNTETQTVECRNDSRFVSFWKDIGDGFETVGDGEFWEDVGGDSETAGDYACVKTS